LRALCYALIFPITYDVGSHRFSITNFGNLGDFGNLPFVFLRVLCG
jgi:hypothetical protein